MFDWTDEEEKNFYIDNIENFARKLRPIEDSSYYIKKLKVVCLVFALYACGKSSTIVNIDDEGDAVSTVENTSPSLVSVFSTRDDKEYLKFLTEMSYEYEIIDITTGMDTYYGGESYVVTYMTKKDNSNAEPVSYKYYLYKTREQSEYLSFYSSFDFDTYEIVDISTRLDTYFRGESYIITYFLFLYCIL